MSVYTQEDFNALERNILGYIHIPEGDWSNVDFAGADRLIFESDCILGDDCTLGDDCILGNDCTLENGRVEHAVQFKVSNIGSRNDSAYAYCNTETGEIFVRAGCWFSGIDAFVDRVKEVHHGTHHETDYLAFADFARARYARYAPKGEDNHE